MRHVLAFVVVWLAGVASASAQVSERLEIGAIVRTDRVSFEGGQNARLPVTGVGCRVSRVAGHADRGGSDDGVGRIEAKLRGRFHFVRGTGATREEFLRMAVIARRTTINKAGLGFAHGRRRRDAAAGPSEPRPARGRQRPAVRLHRRHDGPSRARRGHVRAGRIAAMPDGRGQRGRSGLLFGASVPVRIAGRLHVAPEVRWVWGGPARIGNNYDEATVGARIVWKF